MTYDLLWAAKNVAKCLRDGAFTREQLAEELEGVAALTEHLKNKCHAMRCVYCDWWLPVPSYDTPDSVAASHVKVCPDGPYVALKAEHEKAIALLKAEVVGWKEAQNELMRVTDAKVAERTAEAERYRAERDAQLGASGEATALRAEIDALKPRLAHRDEEIRKLIEVAHKLGWNGVENPKALWRFFEFLNEAKDDEIKQLTSLQAVMRDVAHALHEYGFNSTQALANRLTAAANGTEAKTEPTEDDGNRWDGRSTADDKRFPAGECFVNGWTGHRCVDCGHWVWGGPTRCVLCASMQPVAAASPSTSGKEDALFDLADTIVRRLYDADDNHAEDVAGEIQAVMGEVERFAEKYGTTPAPEVPQPLVAAPERLCVCNNGKLAKDCDRHACRCGEWTVTQNGERMCCVLKERNVARALLAERDAHIEQLQTEVGRLTSLGVPRLIEDRAHLFVQRHAAWGVMRKVAEEMVTLLSKCHPEGHLIPELRAIANRLAEASSGSEMGVQDMVEQITSDAVKAERERAAKCADPHLWSYRTCNAATCLMAAQGEILSGRDPSERLEKNIARDRAEDERETATRAAKKFRRGQR